MIQLILTLVISSCDGTDCSLDVFPSNWWVTSTDIIGGTLFSRSVAPTSTYSIYSPEDLFVEGSATTTNLFVKR